MAPGAVRVQSSRRQKSDGRRHAAKAYSNLSIDRTDFAALSDSLSPTPALRVKNTFIDDWCDSLVGHEAPSLATCPAALAPASLKASLAEASASEDSTIEEPCILRKNGELLEVNFDGVSGIRQARERAANALRISADRVMLVGNAGVIVDDSAALDGIQAEELQIVVLSDEEARLKCTERRLNDVLNDDCLHRLTELEMTSADETTCAIKIILLRALDDAYRCQHYVDVLVALNASGCREDNSPPGTKPTKFKRSLLDACQKEYEALFFHVQKDLHSQRITGQALEAYREKYQHRRRIAMISLFSKLFVNGLLAIKVIERVFEDLIEQCQPSPDPYHIEYICNLLSWTGEFLDRSSKGQVLVNFVMAHLSDFRGVPICSRAGTSTRGRFQIDNMTSDCRPALCKRARVLIDNVAELREARWQKDDVLLDSDSMAESLSSSPIRSPQTVKAY